MRWIVAALLLVGALAMGATASHAAEPHEILIESGGFDPQSLTITVGEAVYWCNADSAVHSVVFDEGEDPPDSGPLNEDDCTEDLILDAPGTYSYHDGHSSLTGSIVVQSATTTTEGPTTTTVAAPTTVAPTPTTARVTTTTRRRTTTTAAFKRSASRDLGTTTTSEATTTTLFETTTSEFTTTTFGAFVITESTESGNGSAALVIAGLGILGGAGYLGYRYRYRFMR
jgi:plastocyanin